MFIGAENLNEFVQNSSRNYSANECKAFCWFNWVTTNLFKYHEIIDKNCFEMPIGNWAVKWVDGMRRVWESLEAAIEFSWHKSSVLLATQHWFMQIFTISYVIALKISTIKRSTRWARKLSDFAWILLIKILKYLFFIKRATTT